MFLLLLKREKIFSFWAARQFSFSFTKKNITKIYQKIKKTRQLLTQPMFWLPRVMFFYFILLFFSVIFGINNIGIARVCVN